MNAPTYDVLFLCTGNSARSIMAEAILNHLGRGLFRAHSAGSHPKGEVNPFALAQLKKVGLPTEGCRSKSWNEFSGADTPMDFVFTLCDRANTEACGMIWPGDPTTAHWGIADPAAVEGTEEAKSQAFAKAFLELQTRIALFLALPLESIDKLSLHRKLTDIGTGESG
jgi:arsenate reductase